MTEALTEALLAGFWGLRRGSRGLRGERAVRIPLPGRSAGRLGHRLGAFSAGAILTMLASITMPEAYEGGGEVVGVVTAIGFLVAFVLSRLG